MTLFKCWWVVTVQKHMASLGTKVQRVHTLTLPSWEYTDLHQQKCFDILVHTFTSVHHSSPAELGHFCASSWCASSIIKPSLNFLLLRKKNKTDKLFKCSFKDKLLENWKQLKGFTLIHDVIVPINTLNGRLEIMRNIKQDFKNQSATIDKLPPDRRDVCLDSNKMFKNTLNPLFVHSLKPLKFNKWRLCLLPHHIKSMCRWYTDIQETSNSWFHVNVFL